MFTNTSEAAGPRWDHARCAAAVRAEADNERPLLQVLDRPADLAAIAADWARLAAREARHFPAIAEVIADGGPFRVILARAGGEVRALGCVLLERRRLDFFHKPLRRGPAHEAVLLGAALAGAPDKALADAMLTRILEEPAVRYLRLGDVERASGLHAAAVRRRPRWLRLETDWLATRRLAALPATFAGYLASLRASTRRGTSYQRRVFERLRPRWRVFAEPGEMATLVEDAMAVAATNADSDFLVQGPARAARVERYRALAARGAMLGYVAYLDERPVAFRIGDIAHGVFACRHVGFDPAVGEHNPGIAMQLHSIEHMIASGACTRVDFGGRDMPHKARLSNLALDCVHVSLGTSDDPAAAMAILRERVVWWVKPRLFGVVGGRSGLRRLKHRLGGGRLRRGEAG